MGSPNIYSRGMEEGDKIASVEPVVDDGLEGGELKPAEEKK